MRPGALTPAARSASAAPAQPSPRSSESHREPAQPKAKSHAQGAQPRVKQRSSTPPRSGRPARPSRPPRRVSGPLRGGSRGGGTGVTRAVAATAGATATAAAAATTIAPRVATAARAVAAPRPVLAPRRATAARAAATPRGGAIAWPLPPLVRRHQNPQAGREPAPSRRCVRRLATRSSVAGPSRPWSGLDSRSRRPAGGDRRDAGRDPEAGREHGPRDRADDHADQREQGAASRQRRHARRRPAHRAVGERDGDGAPAARSGRLSVGGAEQRRDPRSEQPAVSGSVRLREPHAAGRRRRFQSPVRALRPSHRRRREPTVKQDNDHLRRQRVERHQRLGRVAVLDRGIWTGAGRHDVGDRTRKYDRGAGRDHPAAHHHPTTHDHPTTRGHLPEPDGRLAKPDGHPAGANGWRADQLERGHGPEQPVDDERRCGDPAVELHPAERPR